MDEGVDPTHMCESLVSKVIQSKKLKAVADPEILILFEEWLEELEEEVLDQVGKAGSQDPGVLAPILGLSHSGAAFLVTKLKREGKLS